MPGSHSTFDRLSAAGLSQASFRSWYGPLPRAGVIATINLTPSPPSSSGGSAHKLGHRY
jgi:hypothetical protein